MYVDESGVESVYDKTKFFITAGVIIHEDDLESIKKTIRDYVDQNFSGSYKDAEIHIFHMYKGKGKFVGVNPVERMNLLNSLYAVIQNLSFTAIVIGIDKAKFIARHSDPNEILDFGHILLVERFDKFLEEHNNKGIIRIDRTTGPDRKKLNQKDANILKIINRIRKRGTRWQTPAVSIIEEPTFISSYLRIGLQLADSVAYCANRHINQLPNFDSFWKIVYTKLRIVNGNPIGYGYRIYPR